jgi:hypothetical protein
MLPNQLIRRLLTDSQPVFFSMLLIGFFLCTLNSCAPVKEYQKNKLNDSEMILTNRKIEKTELSFLSYREGASGANAGKSGGGCGCN